MGGRVPGPICEEPVQACIDEGTLALVCAFLTHRAVKAWKGRYQPETVGDPTRPAGTGASGYAKSQLLRYLEEALAESYAQLRVNGVKGLPAGIKFPIDNAHYQVTISGVLREAAIVGGIYVGAITVGGIAMYVYLEQSP